jgi:hypothetical protein
MIKIPPRVFHPVVAAVSSAALSLMITLGSASALSADEADAKKLVKAMSDDLAVEKAISFSHDTNLEVVTTDHQKLLPASSGMIEIGRPDKLRVTRFGGFANVEVNAFIEPQYTVWNDRPGAPRWQISAGVNFQFPIRKQTP